MSYAFDTPGQFLYGNTDMFGSGPIYIPQMPADALAQLLSNPDIAPVYTPANPGQYDVPAQPAYSPTPAPNYDPLAYTPLPAVPAYVAPPAFYVPPAPVLTPSTAPAFQSYATPPAPAWQSYATPPAPAFQSYATPPAYVPPAPVYDPLAYTPPSPSSPAPSSSYAPTYSLKSYRSASYWQPAVSPAIPNYVAPAAPSTYATPQAPDYVPPPPSYTPATNPYAGKGQDMQPGTGGPPPAANLAPPPSFRGQGQPSAIPLAKTLHQQLAPSIALLTARVRRRRAAIRAARIKQGLPVRKKKLGGLGYSYGSYGYGTAAPSYAVNYSGGYSYTPASSSAAAYSGSYGGNYFGGYNYTGNYYAGQSGYYQAPPGSVPSAAPPSSYQPPAASSSSYQPPAATNISSAGVAAIQQRESAGVPGGFESMPTFDSATGKYEIGYGTEVSAADAQQYAAAGGITQDQATALMSDRLNQIGNWINNNVTVPLTQDQFDALSSLAYNVGTGPVKYGGLTGSNLITDLNAGNYQGAASEFLQGWDTVKGGSYSSGLANRRIAEYYQFTAGGGYNPPALAPGGTATPVAGPGLTVQPITALTPGTGPMYVGSYGGYSGSVGYGGYGGGAYGYGSGYSPVSYTPPASYMPLTPFYAAPVPYPGLTYQPITAAPYPTGVPYLQYSYTPDGGGGGSGAGAGGGGPSGGGGGGGQPKSGTPANTVQQAARAAAARLAAQRAAAARLAARQAALKAAEQKRQAEIAAAKAAAAKRQAALIARRKAALAARQAALKARAQAAAREKIAAAAAHTTVGTKMPMTTGIPSLRRTRRVNLPATMGVKLGGLGLSTYGSSYSNYPASYVGYSSLPIQYSYGSQYGYCGAGCYGGYGGGGGGTYQLSSSQTYRAPSRTGTGPVQSGGGLSSSTLLIGAGIVGVALLASGSRH